MNSWEARESTNASTARGGILITLDEVDKVPACRLARFQDTMQGAGRKVPVAIVLAKTTGIEDTLRGDGYWYQDRVRQLAVGRLDSAEAETVIAEPFAAAGITVFNGTAAELAEAADYYPCFLQVYGEAAWEAMASAISVQNKRKRQSG